MSLDRRTRAARAQQLLDDDVLRDALDAVETDAIDRLASADVADTLALQRHAAALQAARAVRANLTSHINTGRLSEREPPAVA